MKSMTGYASGEFDWKQKRWAIEVKTVNHRFCEVNLRLPPRFAALEIQLIEFARQSFHRGRIDLFIREKGEHRPAKIKVNLLQLDQYLNLLQEMKAKVEPTAPFQLESILTLPQVLCAEEEEENLEEALETFKRFLTAVFQKAVQLREKEGEGIRQALQDHLNLLSGEVRKVETAVPDLLQLYRARLQERVEKWTGFPVDEWKLAQEFAYFVDRSDVSEELQRLKSHCLHFQEVLSETGGVGRKLEFILQEMNREVNTLGSKIQNSDFSRSVVLAKHELEKMKEQIQNIE